MLFSPLEASLYRRFYKYRNRGRDFMTRQENIFRRWIMKAGMNRREFLGFSIATGALLMAGEVTKGAAVAQGTAKVTEVDKLTVWVVTDNYYDALRKHTKIAKRYRSVPGKAMLSEHGVSFYLQTVVNGKESEFMFDYGHDSLGVKNNLSLLGLDLGKASAFSLSHGHWDHFWAATNVLKQNQSRIAGGTPFYVGEEAFAHRYSLRPGATEPSDLGQFKKEDIESLGLNVVEVKKPVQVIPGGYFTGNIDRVTAYEKVPPTLLIKRGEKPEPDDFHGEQGLFFNVKGKGLVVISGCAHAGIVNTVKHAQKVSGIEKIHAVMGGFHLINAKPEIIRNTVADIKAMKPDYIIPMHCSGFETILAFSREMPNEFTINTAGTQYTFSA
jgi:7,8-dihydropterin-6-yl-methyl-4-(beta-D-ribofuranosyl)aminobenzene 5'-phosphate synthase